MVCLYHLFVAAKNGSGETVQKTYHLRRTVLAILISLRPSTGRRTQRDSVRSEMSVNNVSISNHVNLPDGTYTG